MLVGGDLHEAYRTTLYCAQYRYQVDGRLRTHYCKRRWCITCNRIRTAQAINAYEPVIRSWSDPHFVTLTCRNVSGDDLKTEIDRLGEEMRACIRTMRESRRTSSLCAVRKMECTFNLDTGTYHPHYHLIADDGASARRLVEQWLRRNGDRSLPIAQDVRPADEGSYVELAKYATKVVTVRKGRGRGDLEPIPPKALDTIYQALTGRRTWQPIGCRAVKVEDGDDDEFKTVGTPAWKRIGEAVTWEWERGVSDWVDRTTGDMLTGYIPSERDEKIVAAMNRSRRS